MNFEHVPPTWPPSYPRHRAVSVAQTRVMDLSATRDHGIPSLVLMEHAAQGVAAVASMLVGPDEGVVVLAGPGNNGGDGYAVARFLASWGRFVRVLRLAPAPPRGGDAALEAALWARLGPVEDAWAHPALVPEALSRAGLVVDAVFGTGAVRVEGPYPLWFEAVNRAHGIRLAVDVPSGLDGDTGLSPGGAVRAHVTATLAAPKKGFSAGAGPATHVGRVVEVDIGLPPDLLAPHVLPAVSG